MTRNYHDSDGDDQRDYERELADEHFWSGDRDAWAPILDAAEEETETQTEGDENDSGISR